MTEPLLRRLAAKGERLTVTALPWVAPVFRAIESMGLAGDALRGGALDTRITDWRRWVETVRGVFAAADDAWTGIAAELR